MELFLAFRCFCRFGVARLLKIFVSRVSRFRFKDKVLFFVCFLFRKIDWVLNVEFGVGFGG